MEHDQRYSPHWTDFFSATEGDVSKKTHLLKWMFQLQMNLLTLCEVLEAF
jgi:hypothetical protein